MEISVITLLLLVLTIMFSFINLDYQKSVHTKQNIFESIRAANQNSLYEIQDQYDNYEEITTVEMLDKWIINFCNNNSINMEEMKISFIMVSNDPVPLYLVNINGVNGKYISVNAKTIASYYYGALLIEKNEDE